MEKLKATWLFLVLLILNSITVFPQDPTRFEESITSMPPPASSEQLIIFTGSSSIRKWTSLTNDFPRFNVINRGFGGSQMSDLLYYLDKLVLHDRPCQVFIYEGDNDLGSGKSIRSVIQSTNAVLRKIWEVDPRTDVVLITAKPSIRRWHLARRYKKLNKRFTKLAAKNDHLKVADVWTPCIGPDGLVMRDIFVEDELHMNEKGYDIWRRVIEPYLKHCD